MEDSTKFFALVGLGAVSVLTGAAFLAGRATAAQGGKQVEPPQTKLPTLAPANTRGHYYRISGSPQQFVDTAFIVYARERANGYGISMDGNAVHLRYPAGEISLRLAGFTLPEQVGRLWRPITEEDQRLLWILATGMLADNLVDLVDLRAFEE